MSDRYDVLIVGSGHAGAQAAIALTQRQFPGSIAVLGEEAQPPYERPPLSKEYLSGEKSFERLLIRPTSFWSERGITLLSQRRAVGVNPSQRLVTTDRGEAIGYGRLVWAAGGHARKLTCEGHDLRGVHTLRTRADVDSLLDELSAAQRIAVIGGGYIGLEAAAVLSKFGKRVTILEAQDRVLARVAGVELSRFYEAEHRAHGVDVRLGVEVEALVGEEGRVRGVRLKGGEVTPAEIVIVGIGIVPAVEQLLEAGALGGPGVEVDAYCRTSLPDIWAVGDCALHAIDDLGGNRMRIESVQNAVDMSTGVAKAITGAPEPYKATPWFWSNQYDLRLQTVGLSAGHDQTVLRGDPRTRSFSIVYLRRGEVRALDCVNATKDYVQGRALVTGRVRADAAELADPTIPLKSLVT